MSSNALDIILGAIIAIGTSIVSSLVLDSFHKRQERKEIKVLLLDELNEIIKELGFLEEYWKNKTNILPNYVQSMKNLRSNYENISNRLFLIKNDETRRRIRSFYSDLKTAAYKYSKNAGTLSNSSEAKTEQAKIANEFIDLKNRAETLKDKLK